MVWNGTRVCVASLCAALLLRWSPASVEAAEGIGTQLLDDGKYVVDNAQLDIQDIVTAPLHIADENSVFRSPRFYLTVAGVGALVGGAYGLDNIMRNNLHNMSSSSASALQSISYGTIGGGTALLYGYGLWNDDDRARHYALTAAMGAGVATILDLGVKAAFGRLRPRQNGADRDDFWKGGQSFVSGEVTGVFGLATGISEYFDNEWYIAAPVYSLALLDGFGRMGHNAHWFSDVVGGALLGFGTTKLFLYLHQNHEGESDRWRIFPLLDSSPAEGGRSASPTMGLEIAYSR